MGQGNVSPKGSKDGTFVPSHNDGDVLSCVYLHQLEEAIKSRTPIGGAGINVVRTDGGTTIQLSGGLVKLNVCSNGTPSELQVYGLVT
jgi:hypothetical protein